MKLFPYRRKSVASGLTVKISNHHISTMYGVRGVYDATYKAGEFIECGSPGTGFFARTTGGHQYNNFCKAEKAKLAPKYLNLLLDKEFSYSKEIERARKAIHSCSRDDIRREILNRYATILPDAQKAEEVGSVVNAIKDLSKGRHGLTGYQKQVLSVYKNQAKVMNNQAMESVLKLEDITTPERYAKFERLVDAFEELAGCHHIYCVNPADSKHDSTIVPVFFDLGIFDYVQVPRLTPMLRDGNGRRLFLYPDFVIYSRDAVDFEVIDMKKLTLLCRETPYDMVAPLILNSGSLLEDSSDESSHHQHHDYERFGNGLLVSDVQVAQNERSAHRGNKERVMGEMFFIECNLRYYVRNTASLRRFSEAWNEYKDELMKF